MSEDHVYFTCRIHSCGKPTPPDVEFCEACLALAPKDAIEEVAAARDAMDVDCLLAARWVLAVAQAEAHIRRALGHNERDIVRHLDEAADYAATLEAAK